jgi:hypothetical protein
VHSIGHEANLCASGEAESKIVASRKKGGQVQLAVVEARKKNSSRLFTGALIHTEGSLMISKHGPVMSGAAAVHEVRAWRFHNSQKAKKQEPESLKFSCGTRADFTNGNNNAAHVKARRVIYHC